MAPRRTLFTPGFALIATALLLAALGGTIAVGAWLNREVPIPEVVTYENGVIMANGGCGQLVSLDPTSGEIREVVAASTECDFDNSALRPAWSSDGSRLAYLAAAQTDLGMADEAGVWVYEAATGETRQVTECSEYCDGVDISPDGSHVAYITYPGSGTYALAVVAVDGGETYRIDLPGGRPGTGGAAFSPDGSHIALSMIGGKSGVYLVDVSGIDDGTVGGPTLLHGIVQADYLAWSPNGEWIAYTQTGGLGVDGDVRSQAGAISQPGSGIVVVRADGTEVRALATGFGDYGPIFPTWSADSATVAYLAAPNTNPIGSNTFELWTAAIDGSEPTRIYETDRLYGLGLPVWSPDGEWIAFGAVLEERDPESGLMLLRADGSEAQYAPGMPHDPAWQPIPED